MTFPTDPTAGRVGRLPDPLPIVPFGGPVDGSVRVPGSKSITNRALVCAALATGPSTLRGALFADDTEAMLGVLAALGVTVQADPGEETIVVEGCGGVLPVAAAELDVRQSGTTARFTLPLVTLGAGTYRVSGHPQMQARPMGPTLDALRLVGVPIEELAAPGHLPVVVRGGAVADGVVRVPGDVSSQFLSGLLLMGPCRPEGLLVEVTTELVSRPYVEITLAVMRAFGATIDCPDETTFVVAPGGYRGRDYAVEPDASAASYPFAVAAICGGRVRVEGLGAGSVQGDAAFADVLGLMGATVERDASGTTVSRYGSLGGGTFDFTHISDTAPTLAAVSVFADGPTEVTGVGFIRQKESDRIAAVVTELRRCGIEAHETAGGWTVVPGTPRPAVVQTYEDHRMAMAFALLGLRVPGIAIAGPSCVAKTFPDYFAALEQLRPVPGLG